MSVLPLGQRGTLPQAVLATVDSVQLEGGRMSNENHVGLLESIVSSTAL